MELTSLAAEVKPKQPHFATRPERSANIKHHHDNDDCAAEDDDDDGNANDDNNDDAEHDKNNDSTGTNIIMIDDVYNDG